MAKTLDEKNYVGEDRGSRLHSSLRVKNGRPPVFPLRFFWIFACLAPISKKFCQVVECLPGRLHRLPAVAAELDVYQTRILDFF